MADFDFVRIGTHTTGGACPDCGEPYGRRAAHGAGICYGQNERVIERWMGLTADDVRRIVREELERERLRDVK